MLENTKVFIAYCRKLFRALDHIEKALEDGKIDTAKELVRELKVDTQKDIEAEC